MGDQMGPDDEPGVYHDPLIADQVYIMMRKEFRISRNVRAQWFIEHLNKVVTLEANRDDANRRELNILSIVPSDPPKSWSVENNHLFKYFITPATRVIFLAEKYRMVYCLDISPSLSAVDIEMGEVMLDCLVASLKASLEGVSKKFIVPGSKIVFQPDVYATIIAHTPFFTSPAQQVLVQGWQVTPQNLPQLLTILEQQLQELEGKVAEVSGIAQAQLDALRAESERLVGGLFEETLQPITSENPMVSPDTGFINMLRFGMLALKLLPDSSSANIIVVTDGIINIPDVNIFDLVLSQLRSSTVCCSFIQVAGPFHPNCCKGFVPYTELMQFLASATQGAYVTAAHKLEISTETKMNYFHEAFLTWSFQHSAKEFCPKSEKRPFDWAKNTICHMSNEIKDRMLIRKKQVEDTLNARLTDVLSCRLREGYIIKSLSPKDVSSIEVCLVLPWKNDIYIEYLVTSQLPPTNSVHYVVTIEAPYEFLHDITCLLKKPFKSHYRQGVVARFWHTLKNLTNTDQLLVHLHSFGSNSASYSLPDSIKSGMSLFHLPNNKTTPALISSEASHPQFSSYWKPICLLDAAVWQKWLHPHRLGLLLQHDFPLPRYLHQANPSGRFQQVQCRQAASVLFSTLKAWSSFVLIENHTYVKLIQNDNEKAPSSFMLMRVTSKLPCVVINLAFLGGASGALRHRILEELKAKMRSLTFPQRPLGKETIIRKYSTAKNVATSPDEQKGVVTWSDLSCCILLIKPVEKILIRYERMPPDFATVVFPDGTQPVAKPGVPLPVVPASGGSSMLTTLSRYLHHRRWIWVAHHNNKGSSNSAASLTRTLTTITKMRLQEGFSFAHSTAGIINMLLEVTMQAGYDTHPCVVQYVLFPPHQVTNKESGSDEECTEEVEPNEPDGELQIITECWIEPQYGHIIDSPPERAFMDGLSYDQLADEICKVDAECISSLLTFEHLSSVGNEKSPASLPVSTPIEKFMRNNEKQSYCASMKMLPEQRINMMPFTFNLMNLLPKCQQAEMLFSSFIQDLSWSFPNSYEGFSYLDTANNLLLNIVYESLLKCNDCELYLSHIDSKMFLDFLRERERDSKIYPSPIPQLLHSEEQGKQSPGFDNLNEIPPCEKFLASLKLCKYPKWKCYLKRISGSHLVLTFVPASFADLKLLMLNQTSMESQCSKSVKFFANPNPPKHDDDNLSVQEGDNLFKDSLERLENLSIPESHSVPEMCEQIQQGLDLAGMRPPLPALTPFRERAYSLDAEQRKRSLLDFRKRTRTSSMDSRHKKKFSLQPLSPPQLEDVQAEVVPEVPTKMEIPPNHIPQFGAVTLPIFVYDCPLNMLIEVLVYKESEKKAADIFDDNSCSRSGEQADCPGQNFQQNLASPEPKSEDSDIAREVLSLKQHCKLIKSSFHRAYVSSLFKSLQLNSFIHSEDVQSAVQDCDETSVEIDLTKFIKAVCGHLKEFWLSRKLDLFKLTKGCTEQFGLGLLQHLNTCGRLKPRHSQIKEQFAAILAEYFRAVPSNSRFFFSIPKWEREQQVDNVATENDNLADLEDANSNYSHEFASRRGSQSWEIGGDDTHTSDSVSDLPEEESPMDMCPLFLHLVCSVQHNNGIIRQPIASLPTCLAEIDALINSGDAEINLSALRVFLDVQCLTLVPSLEPTAQIVPKAVEPNTEQPAANQTLVSSTLNTSVSSSSSVTETELKSEEIISKIAHLPDYLQKAMVSTMNKIKWLLQDELATFLLDVYPPSESMLQMVAQHVVSSFDRSNCSFEKIDLHFVYAAEHSLSKFLDKFAQMRIGAYYLRKEGKYYHLVQDKTARQHKMQSTPVNGPNFKSIATPSSLAEDSSEMSIYPQGALSIPPGHYSESDIQALGLDSTPTDEPLSRPLSDLKLSISDMNRVVEKIKNERKASADILSSERKHQPPNSLWLEACSTSAPTPGTELDKESLGDVIITEGIDHENLEALWNTRIKSMSRPGSNKTPGRERIRNNSGAISTTGPNSETSSFIESAHGTEEGGYEGDSSEDNNSQSEEYLGWGHEEYGGVSLPNFWLIMEVTNEHVITYFHCRTAGKEASKYREVRNRVISSILETCKHVNQIALLQSLHDTKICDDLLESDLTRDTWESKSRSSSCREDASIESIFKPGAFACNVVWETQFVLHPRLKTGPAKRGIQALETVLSRFPVNNRKNMFVYQDNLQNVFYLRLQEPTLSLIGSKMTPSSSSNQGIFLTDGEMTPPGTSVARSPSISSLKREDTRSDIRPRVKSYGERDMPLEGFSPPLPMKTEEAVTLRVHGISEAGSAIKEDLVQVLHNRLNDAVLEVLCGMFSRNPMCKLTPDDVHFIQKPYKQADMSIEFSIQPFALDNLKAFVFYLKQNLLEFVHTPKYTDSKVENHFQDYTHDVFSKDRVPEEDIFLYNQSRISTGNRGMACIAVAIVDSNGCLIKPDHFTKPNNLVHLDAIVNMDFVNITSTQVCNADCNDKSARVEFRIWKQGKVNLDLLTKNLQSSIHHALWDLHMEYRLLTAPLAQKVGAGGEVPLLDSPTAAENSSLPSSLQMAGSPLSNKMLFPLESIDKYESGEAGRLHQIYHWVISEWLSFAMEIGVPSVKKHSVHFKSRQAITVTLKEIQKIITANASDNSVAIFKLAKSDNQDIFVPFEVQSSFSAGCRWDDVENSPTCLLFARNLLQWKACISDLETVDPDVINPKAQKVFQKFAPQSVKNPEDLQQVLHFVPRQRLLVANLSDKEVVIFTYNWSKDRVDSMQRQMSNLGNWLVARSSLTTTIVCQKMGLFNNMLFNRQAIDSKKAQSDPTRLSIKDVEQLIKPPAITQKDFNLGGGRRASVLPTAILHDVFRDIKPSRLFRSNSDPVSTNGQHLLELFGMEKKDSQKKLFQLWETRAATPNIPVLEDLLQLLKQHSRVVHFCLTPLLYLPSWRIQAAATRDHTLASNVPMRSHQDIGKSFGLAPPSRHESGNSLKSTDAGKSTKSNTSPQTSPKFKQMEDKWHQKLCLGFIEEYKRYLTTLGFVPIQTEAPSPKKSLKNTAGKDDRQRKMSGSSVLSSSSFKRIREENSSTCHFLQKTLLGGILIFEISLHEPFFQAKLYALECARLQAKASSGMISQFTFSFLDESDKIKILMHLHSFTYDYHLRSIHQYITNHHSVLKQNFHLRNFLDDFIKYYSKGPNFARNLVYADAVRVTDLSMPALQLFNFLWTHEDLYKMEVFCMSPENEFTTDNEYVLLQLKSTHPVMYKDSHDVKQTDDFDVSLVVAHAPTEEELSNPNILHLKYYILLTSRREHFPKHIVERKLGKFCTVPLATPPQFSLLASASNPNFEEDQDIGEEEEENPESDNSVEPEPQKVGTFQQQEMQLLFPHLEIKQENVNYMGYYSSHEQLMQQLILQQASESKEQVLNIIHQGMEHCRTHMLWEALLCNSSGPDEKSKKNELSYEEFHELLQLASMESLSSLDPRLGPLLCQRLSWYQSLEKVLMSKYGADVVRRYCSPDTTIQHTVVLSANYLEAFVMLSIDGHTDRGELWVVCRKGQQERETLHSLRFNSPLLQNLVENFVNACCFHLWAGLI